VLRRRSFFDGAGDRARDVTWLTPDGREMGAEDWRRPEARALALRIDGEASDERDDRGRPVKGDTVLLCVNGGPTAQAFVPPPLPPPARWTVELDTASPQVSGGVVGAVVTLPPFSLLLLVCDRGC
jgi:glycogen operon protein